jgi:hypothetical protein
MNELDLGDATTLTNGPDKVEFERREDPLDSTRKFRLPIVRSIPWSRVLKTKRRADGCGRKLMEPNLISLSLIVELLLGGTENIADSMTPAPKLPIDGAN